MPENTQTPEAELPAFLKVSGAGLDRTVTAVYSTSRPATPEEIALLDIASEGSDPSVTIEVMSERPTTPDEIARIDDGRSRPMAFHDGSALAETSEQVAERGGHEPPEEPFEVPSEWSLGAQALERRIMRAEGLTPAAPTVQLRGRDPFEGLTAAELLSLPTQFDWTVRQVLVSPTYGMIAGEQKTLKTYVGLCLDVAVASGEPFLGEFEVSQPGPVMALVGEGGRAPWTRRLERVTDAMGIEHPDDLPLLAFFDLPAVSDDFLARLRTRLDQHRPKLVHLDPWYAFHPTQTDSRNLHQEGALLRSIQSACDEADATLIINNHFNKTGSGAQNDLARITQAGSAEWVDTWMLLSHRESPDVENGHFQLAMDISSRQWGGTRWAVDFNVGRMGEDGNYDSPITYTVTRASTAARADKAKATLKEQQTWIGRLELSAQTKPDTWPKGLTAISGVLANNDGQGRPATAVKPLRDALIRDGVLYPVQGGYTLDLEQLHRWKVEHLSEPRPIDLIVGAKSRA